MLLDKKNIYAFDECSILHQCVIKAPEGFAVYFRGDTLCARYYERLLTLLSQLNSNNIPKYKFVPSNFQKNIIKVTNQLIKDSGVDLSMLPNTAISVISDQIEDFRDKIIPSYEDINKCDDIDAVKKIFESGNIGFEIDDDVPGDDDCKIIAGYDKISCEGKKYLISDDKHFKKNWKIINEKYKIGIVPESRCHELCKSS
ncbi:MAG: hypothetical protein KKF46_02985 [Nanoarchaeota archaeon]|nr:hypothetical protein [Nanoarchaeota archaeon]MBU1321298.1 hypothetical protein [Nanoarchaeota archaeon]MBU2441861.1 hypothetical protein [Nanoarchaeota archaeon]